MFNYELGQRESLLVRAPDSRSKGCEFESLQKRRENFLLQSQPCVLTPKHVYTFDPTKSEWADYDAVQA